MSVKDKLGFSSNFLTKLSMLIFMCIAFACAAEKEFIDSNKTKKKQNLNIEAGPMVAKVSEIEQMQGTEKIPIDSIYDSAFFSGVSTVIPRNVGDQNFWVAVRNLGASAGTSSAYHYKLQGGKLISKKTYTGMASPGNGGTRIYVLEGGSAILAKQGGLIYFLNDQVPEGDLSKSSELIKFQLKDASSSDRSCAVSYQKNGTRMVGIGYGSGRFAEIPLSDNPLLKPDLSKVTYSQPFLSGRWGYSCFLDSVKLVYYSQFIGLNVDTFALKLEDLSPSYVYQNANNAGFESQNVPEITRGLALVPFPGEQTSYAMAGDRLGNVYNGANYTVTHEAVSNTLWATDRSGNAATAKLRVYPHECGSTKKICEGHQSFSYANDLKIAEPLRPVSALGGGYVVGLSRGNQAKVYLLSLKTPDDIGAGVNAELIDTIPDADPYMYTDFTGATLYKSLTRNEIDLGKIEGWDLRRNLRKLYFSFDVLSGKDVSWKNITANIRCYNDPEKRGEFESVSIDVEPMGQQRLIAASCESKQVRYIELELSAKNASSDLNYIQKLQFAAFQSL